MQEMLRLMLLGLFAGLWLSLEEVQCDEEEGPSGDSTIPLCCDTEASTYAHDEDCKNSTKGEPLPVCDMPHHHHFCKFSVGGAANKQCICAKSNTNGGKSWCCLCKNNHCATICHKEKSKSGAATTKFAITNETSPSTFAGQLTLHQIPFILFVSLVPFVVVATVALIVIERKRRFSGRSEVSTTRTNQNEAVSSRHEPTVRENPYEPSAVLELTQQPATSNNTVYSSVQPTGEAVDMGRPVVYAELDNVAVVVSPVYSQPFEPDASTSNAEYTEPYQPDTKSTATAPIPNLYDNIAAVDQQSDVYSLATAIPMSDHSVIYSQPNKPGK